jgi:hypothetical protein
MFSQSLSGESGGVRNQGPGVALRLGFFEDDGEPFQERIAVLVITEYLSSFYSPGHDVLEKAWGLPAIGFAFRRGGRASNLGWRGIAYYLALISQISLLLLFCLPGWDRTLFMVFFSDLPDHLIPPHMCRTSDLFTNIIFCSFNCLYGIFN